MVNCHVLPEGTYLDPENHPSPKCDIINWNHPCLSILGDWWYWCTKTQLWKQIWYWNDVSSKKISCHCKIGVMTSAWSFQKLLHGAQGPGRCMLTSAAVQTTLEVRDSRKAPRTSIESPWTDQVGDENFWDFHAGKSDRIHHGYMTSFWAPHNAG